MTPWTLMRIGSISKVITAVAVMKLIEQRRFALNSTVFGPDGPFIVPNYRLIIACLALDNDENLFVCIRLFMTMSVHGCLTVLSTTLID